MADNATIPQDMEEARTLAEGIVRRSGSRSSFWLRT